MFPFYRLKFWHCFLSRKHKRCTNFRPSDHLQILGGWYNCHIPWPTRHCNPRNASLHHILHFLQCTCSHSCTSIHLICRWEQELVKEGGALSSKAPLPASCSQDSNCSVCELWPSFGASAGRPCLGRRLPDIFGELCQPGSEAQGSTMLIRSRKHDRIRKKNFKRFFKRTSIILRFWSCCTQNSDWTKVSRI